MSSNLGEIAKKLILVFGEKPARGLPKPPPPPPRTAPRIDNPRTWRNAKLSRKIKSPQRDAGGGVGNSATFQITQQWSHISRCFFHTEMRVSFPLLIAMSYCAHLLSACYAEENGVLYSEAEPIKRRRNWLPALSRLHSILQATSLRRTVYTSWPQQYTWNSKLFVIFSAEITASQSLHYKFKKPIVERRLSLAMFISTS